MPKRNNPVWLLILFGLFVLSLLWDKAIYDYVVASDAPDWIKFLALKR